MQPVSILTKGQKKKLKQKAKKAALKNSVPSMIEMTNGQRIRKFLNDNFPDYKALDVSNTFTLEKSVTFVLTSKQQPKTFYLVTKTKTSQWLFDQLSLMGADKSNVFVLCNGENITFDTKTTLTKDMFKKITNGSSNCDQCLKLAYNSTTCIHCGFCICSNCFDKRDSIKCVQCKEIMLDKDLYKLDKNPEFNVETGERIQMIKN